MLRIASYHCTVCVHQYLEQPMGDGDLPVVENNHTQILDWKGSHLTATISIGAAHDQLRQAHAQVGWAAKI